jgi:hypothetical protein
VIRNARFHRGRHPQRLMHAAEAATSSNTALAHYPRDGSLKFRLIPAYNLPVPFNAMSLAPGVRLGAYEVISLIGMKARTFRA